MAAMAGEASNPGGFTAFVAELWTTRVLDGDSWPKTVRSLEDERYAEGSFRRASTDKLPRTVDAGRKLFRPVVKNVDLVRVNILSLHVNVLEIPAYGDGPGLIHSTQLTFWSDLLWPTLRFPVRAISQVWRSGA